MGGIVGGTTFDRYSSELPPPGIWGLCQYRNSNNWSAHSSSTGNFRYSQYSMNVNDIIAAIGVPAAFADPWIPGSMQFKLDPIVGVKLTDEFCKQHNWESHDRQAWDELVVKHPSILLSHAPEHIAGVQVDPIPLPQWMVYAPVQPMVFVNGQMMMPQGYQYTPFVPQPSQVMMPQQPKML